MDYSRQDENEQIKQNGDGCDSDSIDENVDVDININGDGEWNARFTDDGCNDSEELVE
jgi:hypothetical protein